ncbi:MAG TPA: hypothetical protein VK578_25540 [Edaphobacter sp.]|nr:hypothetical protein [Edaphobacter sp.]
MRGVSGLLVLMMASATVWAQEKAHIGPTVLMAPPVSTGCPVGFSAERRSSTQVRYAKDGKQLRGQGLELQFDPQSNPKKILKANVTVHGVNGAARVMPAGSGDSDDVAELFQLEAGAGEESLRHSSIWTKRVATVRWVDLTEVAYADGSVWLASASGRCRIEPNGFLLVAGAK